jgi:ribosomal protein S18 acetylase RimI-like enzyme
VRYFQPEQPRDTRSMTDSISIRPASPGDRANLREAIVTLQEHERRLHASRRPGVEIADAYLAWLESRAAASGGAILVAERGGDFAGFAAGWVRQDDNLAETAESNRYGYISDVCVMPADRGQRIAGQLIEMLGQHLARGGVACLRLSTLAMNTAARRAYERAGFVAYEVVYERPIGSRG